MKCKKNERPFALMISPNAPLNCLYRIYNEKGAALTGPL